MLVSCIVATDENNAIGYQNQIPWYLPADLKYFKKTTTPHHIIMGRNTYESIGKPLPHRINIVITRDMYYLSTGCLIAHSIEEACDIANDHSETEVFIIGGAQIYLQSQNLWDKVYLTRVHTQVAAADAYFPILSQTEWDLRSREEHPADEKNKWSYDFEIWNKK
jgi:dihydrofolate reductase